MSSFYCKLFSHILILRINFLDQYFSLWGGNELGLFHLNIYRIYLVLVFLKVCDHQKLRFFNNNNNTPIIALATTTANTNSNTSNNKETIIYYFLENHGSIVVINRLGFL